VKCRPKSPKNINTGVVVCGYRHSDCFFIADALYPTGWEKAYTVTQGFLTSKNRFLNRQDAAKIAYMAEQVDELAETLISEDLY
jgi:hypothetical protein